MSGKNSISTDKTVFLSLLAGETRLCPDRSPMLRRANAHQLPVGRGHCLTKARCSLCRRGAHSGRSAVADNTLTIKQKSILPVNKTRQGNSLFCSLSGTCPPPLESGLRRICSAATSPSWASAAPAPLLSATSFRLRPPSVLHDDLRCCHCRVRPRC